MLKNIKKEFFAYRNGIVADALRKGGVTAEIIFGLQVPQIAEIARSLPRSMELADELWRDSKVRESRILAAYLFPAEEVDLDKALRLAEETADREQADMLSFRLLKKLPFAGRILSEIEGDRERFGKFPPESLARHLS